MNKRLSKNERLKGRLKFETLFDQGSVLKKFPIKLIYTPNPGAINHLMAVSVPKRNISSAVKRNRIKRQIREIYRLNKPFVKNESLALLFVYQSRECLPYARIEKSIKKLLHQFA
tara:strand:+ start:146 stop:490 length:345 start_codon:yes stop_codon:yes gene_type:complete